MSLLFIVMSGFDPFTDSVSTERRFTDSDKSRSEFKSPFYGQDGTEDTPKPKKHRSHSKAGK